MNTFPRKARLNRAVFTQKAFDSRSLTVLTTLLHRFPEAGRYQVRVCPSRQPEQQFGVQVSPECASHQVNVDLAMLGKVGAGCGCVPESGYELALGGVLGFYVSTGVGGYQVAISQLGEKEKRLLLDNREAVPAGDFFAVTLTRPGGYRLSEENARAETEIRVALPKGERIRTDQPTLTILGPEGFYDKAFSLLAGQSLVVQCEREAHLRLELTKADDGDQPPMHNWRYTAHKPAPPQRRKAHD